MNSALTLTVFGLLLFAAVLTAPLKGIAQTSLTSENYEVLMNDQHQELLDLLEQGLISEEDVAIDISGRLIRRQPGGVSNPYVPIPNDPNRPHPGPPVLHPPRNPIYPPGRGGRRPVVPIGGSEVCYVRGGGGSVYTGASTSRIQAQRRAMEACQRVSRVCSPIGCD